MSRTEAQAWARRQLDPEMTRAFASLQSGRELGSGDLTAADYEPAGRALGITWAEFANNNNEEYNLDHRFETNGPQMSIHEFKNMVMRALFPPDEVSRETLPTYE